MDGWWTLAAGDIEISGPTLYGEATVTGIRVLPLHRSSILRPLCDCLSSHLDSKRRSTAQYPLDPTTVLMDGWMTSSARCSSDWGILRPSALAVFRLITSSNCVGCSTGRSPG